MTQKPGDAKADVVRDEFDKNRQKRELALLKRGIRADMRSNPDEEENSAVIEQRALEAQRKQNSDAPPSGTGKIAVTLVRAVKGWPQAVVAIGVLALVGWWLWLRR